MARISKAQLVGNVVPLATAAARKVDNSRYAEQRRAAIVERKASPFADRYRHPWAREADKLAEELTNIEQTPELLIVSAILRTMDEAAAAKVMEELAPGAVMKRPAHKQAVAAVRASRLTVGQHYDLLRALERLRVEQGK